MLKTLRVTYSIEGKNYEQVFTDTTAETVVFFISLAHSKSTSIINILNIKEEKNNE